MCCRRLSRLLPLVIRWTKPGTAKYANGSWAAAPKAAGPRWKTNCFLSSSIRSPPPLQTRHGLHFGLSQPQTHYWIHRLLPVLRRALVALDMAPERDASRVATSPLMLEGAPAGALDGTERRRQRPTAAAQQTAHDSGKKKAHTDKNVLLINAYTGKVVYLSPTVAGKTHDKKAADEADLVYPVNSTLDKDTGFQGYEPAGILTQQPQKSLEGKS